MKSVRFTVWPVKAAVTLFASGLNTAQIAKLVGLSEAGVYNYLAKQREWGRK